MRELLILLLLAPVGLMVVLSNSLATFKPTVAARSTPVVVSMPVPIVTPGSDIVAVAESWLGVRYLWGGCTRRGVDCSCFVRNVLAVFGINAPRTTVEQIRWATPVTREQIAVGDLVFFNDTCRNCGPNPTHVGLAIGGGLMIDAGDPVQIERIDFGAHYAGAGRPHR
jgi:cell wall-associated NlpC family hydrolase